MIIHLPLFVYDVFLPLNLFPMSVPFQIGSIISQHLQNTINVFLPVLQFPSQNISTIALYSSIHLPTTLYQVLFSPKS